MLVFSSYWQFKNFLFFEYLIHHRVPNIDLSFIYIVYFQESVCLFRLILNCSWSVSKFWNYVVSCHWQCVMCSPVKRKIFLKMFIKYNSFSYVLYNFVKNYLNLSNLLLLLIRIPPQHSVTILWIFSFGLERASFPLLNDLLCTTSILHLLTQLPLKIKHLVLFITILN